MILDRTQAPPIASMRSLPTLDTNGLLLKSGLKAYLIEGGTEDVVRIEVVFNAGTRFEAKPLLAMTCQALLKEGTKNYSAKKLSETFDFYGAQIGSDLTKDQAEFSLLCQGKHKTYLYDMFAEMLTVPQFPEQELDLVKKRGRSALSVNLEKVQFKCRLLFSELMFNGTAYQDKVSIEAYDQISQADLQTHFEEHYNLNEAYVIISGLNTAEAAQEFDAAVLSKKSDAKKRVTTPINWVFEPRERFEKKTEAIQSAIRLGTEAVGRTHEDYLPLFIANTALGGYFGSRLMQNIREEKGYTYGIGSGLNHTLNGSYINIATEVGADVTNETLDEVNKELLRLCNAKIDEAELTLIRNYISGTLVSGFDGPFAKAERIKVLLKHGLEPTFFSDLSANLHGVSAEQIVHISNKYLHPDRMTRAVVGNWK